MDLKWEQLMKERDEWIAHNFPEQTEYQPIFGVVEELGELAHAHLKEQQAIRGEAEEHQDAAKDAIGDLTVFLLAPMKHTGPPAYGDHAQRLCGPTLNTDIALLRLGSSVGQLCSGAGIDNVTGIVYYLCQYCQHRGWNYGRIVMDTWNAVKERDWIARPETG